MRQKFLAILLVLLMAFITFPVTILANTQANHFADMPNNWATEALIEAVNNGLLSGYNGRLYPEKNLTRAEMAAVINRAFGAKEKADISNYTDVKGTDWFYDEMVRAVGMGTFQGYENQLRPNDPITREEVFCVLSNAMKLRAEKSDKTFMDSNEVSEWAQESINGMVNGGYISGSDGKLNPKANITRAEFAQVMHNIIKDYVNTSTVYEEVNSGNVIVNTPSATLKNVTVKGDLIIAEGVGEGEVTLDNVKVEGRILVRAGGENSIIIKGDSEIDTIIIVKQGNRIRIFNETGKEIEVATVEGTADVILEGKFKNVVVQSPNIIVYAQDTKIENVEINGERSKVIVDEKSEIEKVVVRAANVVIEGKGTVEEVEVKASGTGSEITTLETQIIVDSGANDVLGTGGVEIEPNETYINGKTVTQDAKPLEQPSTGGSSGGGAVVLPTMYTVTYSVIGEGGTLTASVLNGGEALAGSSVSFTAVPNEGYKLKAWTVNGVVIDWLTGLNVSRDMIGDVDFKVEFEPIPVVLYTLDIFIDNPNSNLGATVTLKDYENQVITPTQVLGNNNYYDLEAGEYSYTVEKEGYYTLTETVTVSMDDQVEYVTLIEVLPGIVSVTSPTMIELAVGEPLPILPATVEVELDSAEVVSVDVVWDTSSFDINVAGNYVFEGTLVMPVGVENPMYLKATQLVDTFAPPIITVDVNNSDTLVIHFDQPSFVNGESIGIYPKMEILDMLFNEITVDDYERFNPNNVNIWGDPWTLNIQLGNDTLKDYIFYALDHPDGGYTGDGNGVYRKDVSMDLSIFANLFGQASESTVEPFKIKYFIPMDNGVVDYSQPIQGVWQTQAQRDLEIDPVLDTTPPEFVSISPATGGEIWLDEGDTFIFSITASDDNLYRFTPTPMLDIWYYAMEDPYNGDEELRTQDQDENLSVTYNEGTWEFSFSNVNYPISVFADFEDYAGNRWSDLPEFVDDMNRYFDFGLRFLDREDLEAIKAEIALLDINDYSWDTWEDVEMAIIMPETTQTEIDDKITALTTAVANLYEKLVPVADVYTIDSNTVNNKFYVLENDKGTGRDLLAISLASNGIAVMYPDRIEYTPAPGFVGTDSFGYTVKTLREMYPSNVFVYIEPIGEYITSGHASDGTEFGFYSDEGGLKVIIEDENTRELYLGAHVTDIEVIDGELDVTLKYYIGDDLYTKIIGTQVGALVEPFVFFSEMTTPIQGVEIEDVEGLSTNEIEVGKTYYVDFNTVPSDTTDVVVHNWSVVSGDATITHTGELVANSPGEIVLRVESTNSEIPYVFDEITLTAVNMHTVQAGIVGTQYGTIAMSIGGLPIDNPSEIKEGSTVEVVVTPSDETIQVVEWYINGVPTPSTAFSLNVMVDGNKNLAVLLFKPNSSPVAVDDSATITNDITALIDVIANDTDADGDTLSITEFTQGTNGTVTQEGDSLRYAPNVGFIGTDSFEYTITDGVATATGTINITVQPSGVVVGTGNYDTNEIGFYNTTDGLMAVLENQTSTTGLILDPSYTSILGIENGNLSVKIIYTANNTVQIVEVAADGSNVIENDRWVIDSNAVGGTLTSIKYVVDSGGGLHFVYFDSLGQRDMYDKPDLMYYSTTTATKQLLHFGYRENYGGSDYMNSYVNEVASVIAVDSADNVVIMYVYRDWSVFSGIQDHNYYLKLINPNTDAIVTLETYYSSNTSMKFSGLMLTGGSNITAQYTYSGNTYVRVFDGFDLTEQ